MADVKVTKVYVEVLKIPEPSERVTKVFLEVLRTVTDRPEPQAVIIDYKTE